MLNAMSKATFSLSWEAHKNNICSGLGVLQQNEEFVDMTLAADGHFVKVHQMVMALASPYFKDLISSAAGRHPVIYLNKISSSTLSAILEFIYTGEVIVSMDNLSDLIQTAKELHIKGLEDMKLQSSSNSTVKQSQIHEEEAESNNHQEDYMENKENSEIDDDLCYFEITDRDDMQSQGSSYSTIQLNEALLNDINNVRSIDVSEINDNCRNIVMKDEESTVTSIDTFPIASKSLEGQHPTIMQYTVSNQGSIQMILNRFMYYLKHSNRNKTRQWRCVDYLNKSKCPAIVTTRNNIVIQRISAHVHTHHDRRILKKIQAGAVYEAIKEAEEEGNQIKIKVKQDKERENISLITERKKGEENSP